MTTTSDHIATAIEAFTDANRPPNGSPGDNWVMLRLLKWSMTTLPGDHPLARVAVGLPVEEGQVILGPHAIAVLDGVLAGEVTTMDFLEALTNAIEADTATTAKGVAGGPR